MKNIVGADLSRLNSTANQAHFHPNLEGKFQTAPIKDVFSLCEVLKTSLAPMLFFIFSSLLIFFLIKKDYPTKHFALPFLTHIILAIGGVAWYSR